MLKVIRFNYLFSRNNALALFIFPLLTLIFVDALMSFIFPINTQNSLETNAILGIVMAVSSVTGIICDLIFPIIFKSTSWKLKYTLAICIAMAFPLFNVLGIEYKSLSFFMMAAIVWGIYYELITFSVHEFVNLDNKRGLNKEWGIINGLVQFTRIAGPIVGSLILTFDPLFMLLLICPILLICLVVFFISIPFLPDNKTTTTSTIAKSYEVMQEIKYWGALSRAIYDVFLLGFTIVLIDSAYWTIGGLLSQEIFKGQEGLDWVVIVLYSVALVIGASIAARFKEKENQYRRVTISLFISSVVLCLSFFLHKYLILASFFVSSIFLGLAVTFNDACSSRLIGMMRKDNRYLVGFIRMQSSLAYVIGPLILGFVSDSFNYISAFSLVGVIGGVVALSLYLKFKVMPVLPK